MSAKKERLNKLAREFNRINDRVFFSPNEAYVSDLMMDKYCWEGKYKYFVHYYNTYAIKKAFKNMDEAISYLEMACSQDVQKHKKNDLQR